MFASSWEILEQGQPKISRHLAYLRRAGIVEARRDGKWMHYRIVMPPNIGAAQVLRQTLAWLKDERTMQADRSRLSKACCSPAKFLGLQGAPASPHPSPLRSSSHVQYTLYNGTGVRPSSP